MNIKSQLITLLVLFSQSFFANAQDELAKSILKKLSETTQSYSSIRIEFENIISNKQVGINEKTSGVFELQGNSFRIDMPKQLIVNNGKTQWIYLKEMNEIQIMDYDAEEEDAMSPKRLFAAHNEDYKSAYIEAKTVDGVRVHVIDLFPKKSGSVMKVRISVNAQKNQLHYLEVFDKNGGVYSYKIKKFQSNLTLLPFNLDKKKYPNAEVVDLR